MAPAPLLSDSAGDINGLVPKKVDTSYAVTGETAIPSSRPVTLGLQSCPYALAHA